MPDGREISPVKQLFGEQQPSRINDNRGNIPGQFIFSPRIFDQLGIPAYNSVRKCLAELVANAYDAYAGRLGAEPAQAGRAEYDKILVLEFRIGRRLCAS